MGCVRKSCMRPSHRRSGPEPPRRLQLSLRARTPHCRHAHVARCYTFTLFLLLTLCLIVLLRCIDPSSLPSPTAERREFFARPGLGAAACCARRVFAAAACGRGFGAGRGRLLDGELPLPNRISLAAEAGADEASAREDAELIDLEESERMPAA
eukprot:6214834-Pleurochrysis_carterae.AAC.3